MFKRLSRWTDGMRERWRLALEAERQKLETELEDVEATIEQCRRENHQCLSFLQGDTRSGGVSSNMDTLSHNNALIARLIRRREILCAALGYANPA